MRKIWCIVLFLCGGAVFSQSKTLLDSVHNYVNAAINDTDKVNRINKVYADDLWRYNSPEPYKLLKEALRIAVKANYLRGEMRTYGHMLGYSRNRGNSEFAARFSREYQRIALLLGDSLSYARGLLNAAFNYRDSRMHDSALYCQYRALRIFLNNSASEDQLARNYSQLGMTWHSAGNYDSAIVYAKKSLELREKINYGDGIDASLGQIAGIYIAQNNYGGILAFADRAIRNRLEAGDSSRAAEYKSILGYAQCKTGNTQEGIKNQLAAINYLRKSYDGTKLGPCFGRLAESYENSGNFKEGLHYYKLFKMSADSLLNVEKIRSVSNFQTLYDVEDKENQIQLLAKETMLQDQELKLQRYGLILGGVVLCAILLLSVVIYKAYSQNKKANTLLSQQKKVIEEKNKEIIDSINYARRLQGAILPPEEMMEKSFRELFILYKPKDIVSGDFYWFSESDENRIIAVADCTGHGVPGGFMSMLGYESLQELALRNEMKTTSQVLESLDKKITATLNKSQQSFRDGMDMVLCAFSKNTGALQYSGANRPLLQIRDGVLIEHKPDKNNIGGDIDNIIKEFRTQLIETKQNDLFYLFTDGYADQFGGEKGKKFKYKNLQQAILSVCNLPLKDQKEKLNEIFEKWKGEHEQLDDVCIVGIRI